MKVSFITTVFNEGQDIDLFLDSLFAQSVKPSEIIIVDGGSRDDTVKKIKARKDIKLIVKKGNRSVGRNEAIKRAKEEIIACADAGCILDVNWLKNITSPFKDKKVDVVSGFYKPVTFSSFQKGLASYTCVMSDRVNPKEFLPSSRSISFRKKAWKEVGGYPEELDTCEDLVFAKKMKRAGLKFKFVKSAFVWWPQRKNIKEAFYQFLSYAKGDGQALYIRPQVPLIFARYLLGFIVAYYIYIYYPEYLWILIVPLVLYFIWAIRKNYRYINNSSALFILPILQVTSDIAVILGTTVGFLKRFTI